METHFVKNTHNILPASISLDITGVGTAVGRTVELELVLSLLSELGVPESSTHTNFPRSGLNIFSQSALTSSSPPPHANERNTITSNAGSKISLYLFCLLEFATSVNTLMLLRPACIYYAEIIDLFGTLVNLNYVLAKENVFPLGAL